MTDAEREARVRGTIERGYLLIEPDDEMITISENGLKKSLDEAIQRAETRGREESRPTADAYMLGLKRGEKDGLLRGAEIADNVRDIRTKHEHGINLRSATPKEVAEAIRKVANGPGNR